MIVWLLMLVGAFGKLSAQSGEWDIYLGPTTRIHAVMILEVRSDSIVTDLVPGGYPVALESITMMRHLKGSYVGEGIVGGLLAGMLVGGVLPADGSGSRNVSGGHGFAVYTSPQLGKSAGYGLIGALVGGVVGALIDRDEEYDLRSLDGNEKYDLISRLQYEQ
jgi:hypothetical protein